MISKSGTLYIELPQGNISKRSYIDKLVFIALPIEYVGAVIDRPRAINNRPYKS